MSIRAFVNKLAGRPVDAADLHPTLASRSSKEEIEAGLAAELADVDLTVGPDLPSTSRKKQKQIGAKVPRRFRKSKLATWRDSETAVKKHRAARAKRVKREKAARRRNGCQRRSQA